MTIYKTSLIIQRFYLIVELRRQHCTLPHTQSNTHWDAPQPITRVCVHSGLLNIMSLYEHCWHREGKCDILKRLHSPSVIANTSLLSVIFVSVMTDISNESFLKLSWQKKVNEKKDFTFRICTKEINRILCRTKYVKIL